MNRRTMAGAAHGGKQLCTCSERRLHCAHASVTARWSREGRASQPGREDRQHMSDAALQVTVRAASGLEQARRGCAACMQARQACSRTSSHMRQQCPHTWLYCAATCRAAGQHESLEREFSTDAALVCLNTPPHDVCRAPAPRLRLWRQVHGSTSRPGGTRPISPAAVGTYARLPTPPSLNRHGRTAVSGGAVRRLRSAADAACDAAVWLSRGRGGLVCLGGLLPAACWPAGLLLVVRFTGERRPTHQ
jgi:hypothetical protein